MRRSLLISLIVLIIIGCSETPTASFSTESETYFKNQIIQFENQSINADSYLWEFGDQNSSKESNPTHSYPKEGKYYVKLTAFGKGERKQDVMYKTLYIEGCQVGYTGENCDWQVTPKLIKIKEITITKFPNKRPNGVDWDSGGNDGPDIYLNILDRYGFSVYQTEHRENVSTGYDVRFVINNFEIIHVTDPLTIGVYDYDATSSDEFIGGENIIPYEDKEKNENGFPETVTITGDDISLELTYEYSWE